MEFALPTAVYRCGRGGCACLCSMEVPGRRGARTQEEKGATILRVPLTWPLIGEQRLREGWEATLDEVFTTMTGPGTELRVPGVVVLAQGPGGERYHKAFGFADKEVSGTLSAPDFDGCALAMHNGFRWPGGQSDGHRGTDALLLHDQGEQRGAVLAPGG